MNENNIRPDGSIALNEDTIPSEDVVNNIRTAFTAIRDNVEVKELSKEEWDMAVQEIEKNKHKNSDENNYE